MLLKGLVALVVIDYLTGFLAAFILKKWSSNVGFKGIAKKILIFTMVALVVVLENVFEITLLRNYVIAFFIINEALSIIENAANAGAPIPPKLREALVQMKGGVAGG